MTSCFGSRHGAQFNHSASLTFSERDDVTMGNGYHHVNQLQLENLSLFLFHILLCKQAWCGAA